VMASPFLANIRKNLSVTINNLPCSPCKKGPLGPFLHEILTPASPYLHFTSLHFTSPLLAHCSSCTSISVYLIVMLTVMSIVMLMVMK
ncbi:MAG: hypothetical protein ACRC6D_02740, partial [Aeromonas sp.]